MKKLLLILILSITLIGCDTTENDIPTVSIVGTWTGTAIDFTGTAQTEVQGFPVTANLVGEGYDLDFSYTLTENPNTATSEGMYSMEVTTSVLGQSQTESEEEIPVDFSGPWSLDGDTLTLTVEGEEVLATVLELTENSLVIGFTVERTEDNNGTEVTVDMDISVSFSR